jgi:hypothetical protein
MLRHAVHSLGTAWKDQPRPIATDNLMPEFTQSGGASPDPAFENEMR